MPPADETAIKAAIARGQADVLAGNVTPHPTVARLMQAPPLADEGQPAIRAVVWSHAAREVVVARVQGLAAHDPAAAGILVGAVDRTARALGHVARGADGLVPFTYETIVPQTSVVLAFELVTWTKAGEVIAILHCFEASRDIGRERPL